MKHIGRRQTDWRNKIKKKQYRTRGFRVIRCSFTGKHTDFKRVDKWVPIYRFISKIRSGL